MTITAHIWDKVSPINGKDAVFLTEHFKKQNGNDDRVLIAYDGVISRIQQVDDREFDDSDKAYMQGLTSGGMNTAEAIAAAWEKKAQKEHELENTPSKLRKRAYETQTLIAWEGETITVDNAGTLWLHYMSENSHKAALLSELIIAAKAEIRAMFPDAAV